jgi:hypothetical protein
MFARTTYPVYCCQFEVEISLRSGRLILSGSAVCSTSVQIGNQPDPTKN